MSQRLCGSVSPQRGRRVGSVALLDERQVTWDRIVSPQSPAFRAKDLRSRRLYSLALWLSAVHRLSANRSGGPELSRFASQARETSNA